MRSAAAECMADDRLLLAGGIVVLETAALKEESKLKIKLDQGAKMPTRAHSTDAGLDLYAMKSKTIPANGSAEFDTGVHVAIPLGYAGLLVSKSGLNVKHGLTSTGLIDANYTGSVRVKLYNQSNAAYTVKAGDKISQMVVIPYIAEELELVDELPETERGTSGFGSTGR